jgi:hypothetical protein
VPSCWKTVFFDGVWVVGRGLVLVVRGVWDVAGLRGARERGLGGKTKPPLTVHVFDLVVNHSFTRVWRSRCRNSGSVAEHLRRDGSRSIKIIAIKYTYIHERLDSIPCLTESRMPYANITGHKLQ